MKIVASILAISISLFSAYTLAGICCSRGDNFKDIHFDINLDAGLPLYNQETIKPVKLTGQFESPLIPTTKTYINEPIEVQGICCSKAPVISLENL